MNDPIAENLKFTVIGELTTETTAMWARLMPFVGGEYVNNHQARSRVMRWKATIGVTPGTYVVEVYRDTPNGPIPGFDPVAKPDGIASVEYVERRIREVVGSAIASALAKNVAK